MRTSRREWLSLLAGVIGGCVAGRPRRTAASASILSRDDIVWTNKHQTHTLRIERLYDVWNRPDVATDGWRGGLEALREIVRVAERTGKRVRAVGAGWSLSDAAIVPDILVNTMPLNYHHIGLDESDVASGVTDRDRLVFAQCGTSILELNLDLEARRLSLPTSGASNGQTICGAMSTGTHGSALSVGSVQDFVAGIHLIGEGGRHVWIEPDDPRQRVVSPAFVRRLGAVLVRDDRLFRAALVGIGSLGIIHAVLLRVVPIYHLEIYQFRRSWNDVWRYVDTPADVGTLNTTGGHEQPFHFELGLNPYADKADAGGAAVRVYYRREGPVPASPADDGKHREKCKEPESTPEISSRPGPDLLATVGALTDLVRPASSLVTTALMPQAYAERCGAKATHGETFTATQIIGRSMSAEIGLPLSNVRQAVEIMRAAAVETSFVGALALRYVKKSEALLAFTRFEPTCTIELPAPNSGNTARFYRAVCERLRKAGIVFTLHWGQWNEDVDRDRVRAMWGDECISQWLEARRQFLSVKGRYMFSNDMLVRCGLHE